MKKWFKHIFIGCKEASLLSSKEKEFGLSFWETCTHNFHLMYCSMCRRFRKQLEFIHQSLSKMKENEVSLSEDKKNELKRLIENEM